MLACLRRPEETVLLIDEIDRSDHEFEAFLLEFLSDFQISIPERGTIRAYERPVVVLTSNRTRELHEALRRRCVYHWIDYPTPEREMRIIMMRASGVSERAARAVVSAVGRLRREPLAKLPGIAEAVEWAEAATLLNEQGARWPEAFRRSLGVVLKDEDDFVHHRAEDRRHPGGGAGMSDAARPIAHFLGFTGAAAPRGLCRRAGADDGLARGDRTARPAGDRRHPPCRARDAGAAAGALRRVRRAVRRAFSRRDRRRGWRANRATRSRCAPRRIPRSVPSRCSATRPRESGAKATARRAAFGAPLRAGRRGRNACAALPARLPRRVPRRRGYRWRAARSGPGTDARRMFRDAMRHAGEFVRLRRRKRRLRQRRIVVLDRRFRLDEGAHASPSCLRPRAGARRRLGRSVHDRHAAHPHHPAAAPAQSRTGARHRLAAGRRLGRRHPHRRGAQRLSRRPALFRAGARRGGRRALRRPRARRSDARWPTRSRASPACAWRTSG